METTTIIVIAVSVGMFGLFSLALAIAQLRTRGLVAPGALKPN